MNYPLEESQSHDQLDGHKLGEGLGMWYMRPQVGGNGDGGQEGDAWGDDLSNAELHRVGMAW
jgi:hypothetical protein